MRFPISTSSSTSPLLLLALSGILSVSVVASPNPAAATPLEIQQMLAQFPPCSTSCLLTATTAACGSLTNYTCSCVDQLQAISDKVTPCLLQACKKSDIDTARTASLNLCRVALGGASSNNTGGAANSTTSGGGNAAATTNGASANGLMGLHIGSAVLATVGVALFAFA